MTPDRQAPTTLHAWIAARVETAEAEARTADAAFVYLDTDEQDAAGHYQHAGSPQAILRRCAADRQILDEHDDVNDGDCGTCVDGHWGYPTHGGSTPQRHPCRTLRLVAQTHGITDEELTALGIPWTQ
jgi:Family of unknown function (DUF6221)